MIKMKPVLSLFIALCLLYTPLSAASDSIELEQLYTKLAQETVDAMFGKGKIVARVRVSMTEPKYSVKYTKQANAKLSKKKKTEQVYILPGVPALKNLAPGAFNQMPFDSVTTLSKSKVRKILVYLMVDKAFPRNQARKAEPAIRELLGLKEGRDQVKTVYKKFYYNKADDASTIVVEPGREKIVTVRNGIELFTLLTLIGILFAFIRYMKQSKELSGESGSGGGGANVSVNPNIELPKGAGGGGMGGNLKLGRAPQIKHYFDFITEENIEDFIFLLKKENLGPDYIAMILSFIPADLAARVLEELSNDKKAVVAANLIDQRLGNRDLLEKLEVKLKSALECFIGGQLTFQEIFEGVSGEDKKEVLSTLQESDPENYEKMRSLIILFDDLARLSDGEIQLIVSECNLELLATALISVDQGLYDRIYGNVASDAKAMVNQFLELKSENTSKKDIEAAQEYVLKIALSLDEQSKITFRDKITEEG